MQETGPPFFTPRASRRALLGGGAAALAVAATPACARSAAPDEPIDIGVRARPIPHFKVGDASQTRFGRCLFRGGLELSGDHNSFGGLSGLAMDADGGGFLAVNDASTWVRAKLRYDGARPAAIDHCTLAPMLSESGAPLRRTRMYDTESLCLDNGVAYVGVERAHSVLRFDWAKDGFKARGRPIPVPSSFKSLPNNRGIEGIGVAPRRSPIAGSLVAISERSGARSEPTRGFILTGAQRGEFQVALKDEFDVTDLAFLPDGDMLLLERYYRLLRGVGMRIRRIDGASLRPGALLDGPTMMEADLAYQIDNMEALGVHVARDGEIILTLLSDDNFSMLQRTVLLQFVLAGE